MVTRHELTQEELEEAVLEWLHENKNISAPPQVGVQFHVDEKFNSGATHYVFSATVSYPA